VAFYEEQMDIINEDENLISYTLEELEAEYKILARSISLK